MATLSVLEEEEDSSLDPAANTNAIESIRTKRKEAIFLAFILIISLKLQARWRENTTLLKNGQYVKQLYFMLFL